MATLPLHLLRQMHEDVWMEIWKRLPMESLCRFRCVCKWWNSIIPSAFFINLHFTFTSSTVPCNHLKPYLHVTYKDKVFYPPDLYRCISHERYTLCHPLDDKDDEQQHELYFPFQAHPRNHKRFTFVDVIHGVVCILYWSCSTYLWNPSIHKYVALPCLHLTTYGAIGFGYDSSKNDFKVVVIDWISFKVYSARQGFWRQPLTAAKIKHLNPYSIGGKIFTSCFVNGTIHWLLLRSRSFGGELDYYVLMFDCVSEELSIMDIPREVSCSTYEFALFEYDGMLAALVKSASMNLWVMEEHGVPTSWKKIEHASYGPRNERQLSSSIVCDYVYNKSMFLMDHHKAYTNQDIVHIPLP